MSTPDKQKRQLLMEDFAKKMQEAIDNDSTLSINGRLGSTSGEIKKGSSVCVYTFFPGANSLNIQFGQEGMVKGTPAQAIFNADLANNRWVDRLDQNKYLTSEALIQDCINRISHLEASKF